MKKRKVSLEKKRSLRSLKQNWTLLLLLLPACVMILVFNYVPMYGIQIAFRNFNFVDGITGSEWAGLKWFRYLFSVSRLRTAQSRKNPALAKARD